MQLKQIKLITILSIILSISLAIVSYFGAFISSTYERDSLINGSTGNGARYC